ncbi:MAG: hypothetical protein RSB80_03925 [Anaerovoracaceae bacterium]
MIEITKAQVQFLKQHIGNIEEVVSEGDLQILLEVIDDKIVNNILGNDDEPDETGIKLQKVYDQIYNQN